MEYIDLKIEHHLNKVSANIPYRNLKNVEGYLYFSNKDEKWFLLQNEVDGITPITKNILKKLNCTYSYCIGYDNIKNIQLLKTITFDQLNLTNLNSWWW